MRAEARLVFPREYVIAPSGGDVLVIGGSQLHALKGAASGFVPELAASLDGTRTREQVAANLAHRSSREIDDGIRVLLNLRLLEETTDGAPALADDGALGYCRRYRSFQGASHSGREALARFQAARVSIIDASAGGTRAHALSDLLLRCGARQVEVHDATSVLRVSPSLVIFLSFSGARPGAARELDAAAFQAGVPWLRIVVDSGMGFADIGPLFRGGRTPCFECFNRLHGAPAAAHTINSALPDEFWLGLAAAEAFDILASIGAAPSCCGLSRYLGLDTPLARRLTLSRMPGCPRCRTAKGPLEAVGSWPGAALIFEDAVAQEVIGSGEPRPSGPAAGSRLDTVLGRGGQNPKEFLASERRWLDGTVPQIAARLLGAPEGSSIRQSRLLDAEVIGAMAMLTAGQRKKAEPSQQTERWAATGGNLGSIELYVLIREAAGLAPGLYFYQTADHSLARIDRRCPMDIAALLGAASPEFAACGPAALFIATGAYHRVAPKYGAFGYRLLHLDAGTALSQLRLAASGLGFATGVATRWADNDLESALALTPFAEQVTGVVGLWPTGSPVQCGKLPAPDAPGHADHLPAQAFGGIANADDIAYAAYRSSRLAAGNTQRRGSGVSAHRPAARGGIVLPPPATAGTSISDVLVQRRSVREFQRRPVPLSALAAILAYAHHSDVEAWPGEDAECRPMRYIVLAQAVADLEPGAYEFDPTEKMMLSLRPLSRAEFATCFLQVEFAAAPAAIWIVGDLAAACGRHGEFGHRQLLLRAGHSAHRLWMAAIALGMAGCLIGGMVAGAGRELLEMDGYWTAGLLGLALGFGAGAQGAEVE